MYFHADLDSLAFTGDIVLDLCRDVRTPEKTACAGSSGNECQHEQSVPNPSTTLTIEVGTSVLYYVCPVIPCLEQRSL